MTKQLARKPPLTPLPSAVAAPDALGEFDGVTFQTERLPQILRELIPLIEADWRENGIDHDAVPLKIDWDKYLQLDLVGILQIVTARDDGLLVGYVLGFTNPHVSHTTTNWCILDWYWLYPSYRGAGIGRALMEATLKLMQALGVKVVQGSEKADKKHGLFEKLGFKATDIAYRKILEG